MKFLVCALLLHTGCAANTPDTDAGMWWMDASVDGAADATMDAAMDAAVADSLVVNEIHAIGDDWVEIFNAGAAPVSLTHLRLADSDSMGLPDQGAAVDLDPAGSLDPGAYLVVLANLGGSANSGVQTDCSPLDVPRCLEASFGISDSRGDVLFLIDSSDTVLSRVDYPPNTTDATQTYGRLPDGTGPFLVTVPTPGAANMR